MGSGRLENDYAIGRDTTLLPLGEPAYRFELRSGDNTIEGLFPGQKVARAELSYCYAVASDYKMRLHLSRHVGAKRYIIPVKALAARGRIWSMFPYTCAR